MSFRLVPKSVTLNDLERRNGTPSNYDRNDPGPNTSIRMIFLVRRRQQIWSKFWNFQKSLGRP